MFLPNQNKFELDEDCADWAKDLNDYEKNCLFILIEKYMGRFWYGEQGYDNVYVELDVDDENINGLIEKIPYPTEISDGFIDGNNIKIKNRCYYEKEKVEKQIMYMNRNQSKDFFSIFKDLKPKLDQCFIHFENQMSIFEEIPQDKIEKMYYAGNENQREIERKKVYDDFIKDHTFGDNQMNNKSFILRRLSVMFGYHDQGKKAPFNIKLVYFKNVLPQSRTGRLRLYFTYFNFENGVLTHELPWIKAREKRIENKEKKNKKRKTVQVEKFTEENFEELERYRKKKEKWYNESLKEIEEEFK